MSETLRELAYEQLTFSIRRSLHKKIAGWYEYTYAEQLDMHAHVLAKHWEQGNVPDKAMEAYFLAALYYDRVGNHGMVSETATKARHVLVSCIEDGGSDADEDLKVTLARLDLLLCKSAFAPHPCAPDSR